MRPAKAVGGLLTLIVVLMLAGCTTSKRTGQGSAAGGSVTVPTQSAPPAPTRAPTYSQYPVPTTVANDAGKHKQVQIDSCSSSGNSAAATGTVHNTGPAKASYDITVFFTSPAATAVNYATTTVKVDGGATMKFVAERSFAAPDAVLCVLAGVS
jgi:hypothetical protein